MDCAHEDFEETCSHAGGTGLPLRRCLKCEEYFSDEDLVSDAMKWAAEQAGADDDGWADRYTEELLGQGYVIIPWPADMVPLHAGVEADARVASLREGCEMLVVDGAVLRAMARALECIGVMRPIGKPQGSA